MRIIPNVIHGFKSNAERKIFSLLKNLDLGKGWTAYHSLNVSEHEYKQWAELDFVIVGPDGIIVLEIKGGRVACDNGIWSFTDRFGQTHRKSEGPFKQAESGMYALRDKISSVYGNEWQNCIKIGWGVVFPDITFTLSSPEMPKEVICDERCIKTANDFRMYLKQLINYWRSKGKRLSTLDPEDVVLKNIKNYLRPNFDVSPSLHNKVDVIYQEIVQHTSEQYRYLDALEGHERIICSGGAGTGKSFLAIETARRELENGHSVLLIAMHNIFVAYLKAQLEDVALRICSFSELKGSVNSVEKKQFDVLIIDEGQDLMALDFFDVFEKVLKNGLDNGRWRWFMDENYQVGVLGACNTEALNRLKSTGAVCMMLKHNCRNTKQIVSEAELTTGAYIGITEVKGNGPRVRYCSVSDKEDELNKLIEHLESLIVGGVALSDMVILSPVEKDRSIVMKLPNKWKKCLRFINKKNVMDLGQGLLLFSSISDFKGLERRFVMLVDTDSLDNSEYSKALLYIAMTRAHAGLWIAVSQHFKLILLEMQKKNIEENNNINTKVMNKREIYRQERQLLIDYIHRQLIGPYDGEKEYLYSDKPTARYLMGTLYPQNADTKSSYQDEDESNPASEPDDVDDSPLSMAFQRLPASMGISFYVQDCDALAVDVWGGCYRKITKKDIEHEEALPEEKRSVQQNALEEWPEWVRRPLATEELPVTVVISKSDFTGNQKEFLVLEDRAQLHIVWRQMNDGALITVTLLNAFTQEENSRVDPEQCLFQVGIRCRPDNGAIREYPSVSRLTCDEEEEELALQYRDNITYAVGHGCAATWKKGKEAPAIVQTIWMPQSEVKPVTTKLEGQGDHGKKDVLRLQYLANENIGASELVNKLENFLSGYIYWFDELVDEAVDQKFDGAKKRITDRIGSAVERIRRGIALLGSNTNIRQAFALANRAMLMQMIHSGKKFSGSEKNRDEIPFVRPDYDSADFKDFAWRPFQLAYQLLVLESLVNSDSSDRNIVDLLWFPTGGGKTEAYLALAAFELIYRRLVHGEEGAGTSVIKRYTLRLLTTQQFQRAATLVCALELMRKEKPRLLGASSYTLGLWVGEASSPNKYTSDDDYSKGAYELYKDMLEEEKPENPFQLQQCPWCGTKIVPDSRTDDEDDYGVHATQTTFKFYCPSVDCELHTVIPVTVVDEDIYNHPPSFVIGTVDKFARLAWDHRASGIFGGVSGKHKPPSLIIQDELHLISGPLGTIAGVYEAAIDTLIESKGTRPKVIAATATIRRASDQVERLYGRDVCVFPPPGISANDSYFARIDHDAPGRLYLGIMGQGHTPITSLVQTSAVLSQSVLESKISDIAKDSWWTQVIYHNSRRELGKTMTLARDDIPERVKVIASDESNMRKLASVEELSANIRGEEIPKILSRLRINYKDKNVIDILPCTNMISVGVDVSRLGVILIVGQPKTTSEYIQASSRVGRDEERPSGIVVTLYSSSKPRDRSHYENFDTYHGALYRAVEPTSVTPFAPPSRERALHAALVILVRHVCGLGANEDAAFFNPDDKEIKRYISLLVKRMIRAEPAEKANIEYDVDRLVKEWSDQVSKASSDSKPLRYFNKGGRQYSTLLRHFGENGGEGWPTLNSMRNVDLESLIYVLGEK